jgi:hypothetical protein
MKQKHPPLSHDTIATIEIYHGNMEIVQIFFKGKPLKKGVDWLIQ